MFHAAYSNKYILLLLIAVLLLVNTVWAQPQLTTPRTSPAAQTVQTIGVSKIKISYHRPAVKEREIWGALVPYGQVWRAGANENTTVYFSDPVKVEGQELPAGKYGLHMIPTENEWTLIFSKTNTGWGSFGYTESEDALRVKVIPQAAPFEERLSYRFDNPSNESAELVLYWEKLRIPVKIEFTAHAAVLSHMEKELRGQPQFFWQSWNQAANYCLQNNTNHEKGIKWANRSIAMNKNLNNLTVKSRLLAQMGQEKEADKTMKEVWNLVEKTEDENQLNQFGYQLLFSNKTDDAIKVFQKNVKKHPDSWNAYDSLGEGYAKKDDKKNAMKYYGKAMEMTEAESQKNRIAGIINQLK
jgi:tetratricopeptide (TPR) repeat protein